MREILRRQSAISGVPVAEIIRRAITGYLEEQGRVDPADVLLRSPQFMGSLTPAEIAVLPHFREFWGGKTMAEWVQDRHPELYKEMYGGK
jgi:hypothetical protein